MMNYDTFVGKLDTFDSSRIVTVGDLKNEIQSGGCKFGPKEYCDFRYGTNLERFLFDPYSGEKINWKTVKELLVKI